MKYKLTIPFFFIFLGFKTSIYDLQIQTVEGNKIKMSEFKGKKILIASISPDNLEAEGLAFMDSLQLANPAVVVIAMPASDFGGSRNAEIMLDIKDKTSRKIIVAEQADVKKASHNSQNSLMKWLTHDAENFHFDAEVVTDNQIYIISESGVLYAVLEKGVPNTVIEQLLKQEDIKE